MISEGRPWRIIAPELDFKVPSEMETVKAESCLVRGSVVSPLSGRIAGDIIAEIGDEGIRRDFPGRARRKK